MRLLDLFCGAGGCAVGYNRAGFDVTGVDNKRHDDYPFPMVVADAMEVLAAPVFLAGFQVVHASPPCPRYSTATPQEYRDSHPDLIPPVRTALRAWGGTYIIENVPGAPLDHPVLMCGSAMGLTSIRRHRLFESNALLMSPGCACGNQPVFGIYGDHGDLTSVRRPGGTSRGNKARDVAHAQQILGIDWMTSWDDLADSTPPIYCEYLGDQLLAHLTEAAA